MSRLNNNNDSLSIINFDLELDRTLELDPDLAQIIEKFGKPSQWRREPGFPTLVQIILEQQVSLASAKATFQRLLKEIHPLTPQSFLSLNDLQLKAIGFSRQKTRYVRELAEATIEEKFNLEQLEKLDNVAIRQQLKQIKGIGDWTVDMYLMMALKRRDIFPTKDLAVAIAVREIKHLTVKPKAAELKLIAENWRPYRAIATMILWHYYLHR